MKPFVLNLAFYIKKCNMKPFEFYINKCACSTSSALLFHHHALPYALCHRVAWLLFDMLGVNYKCITAQCACTQTITFICVQFVRVLSPSLLTWYIYGYNSMKGIWLCSRHSRGGAVGLLFGRETCFHLTAISHYGGGANRYSRLLMRVFCW